MVTVRVLLAALSIFIIFVDCVVSLAGVPQTEASKEAIACDRDRALYTVEQQLAEINKLDDLSERIHLLVRLGDVLWTYNEDFARDLMKRAYELAQPVDSHKELAGKSKERQLVAPAEDRFVVLEAISRRDPGWARRLTEQLLEELGNRSGSTESTSSADLSWQLGGLATTMLGTDRQGAINLAQATFRFPLDDTLPRFLFALSEFDQRASDLLYSNAVKRYADAPTSELLFLSAYPFGLNRIIGTNSLTTAFDPPVTFQPNKASQRLFLDALLRQVDSTLNAGTRHHSTASPNSQLAELYVALRDLERLAPMPPADYSSRISQLRGVVNAALSSEVRLKITGTESSASVSESFEAAVQLAERESDPKKRDELLVSAVLEASQKAPLNRILGIADKVSNPAASKQLKNYIHFKRCQAATSAGQFEEARVLAMQVDPLDQRAYLLYSIASKSLNQNGDQTRARESLDEVAALANRADNTAEKARALLGVTLLFAAFDWTRTIEVMRDAIKTINALRGVDLGDAGFIQRIEGDYFGHYARYDVEGFSLERVFAALGAHDFDTAYFLAQTLQDRSRRISACIALSRQCLESSTKKTVERTIKEPST